jgi:hypothetical protein
MVRVPSTSAAIKRSFAMRGQRCRRGEREREREREGEREGERGGEGEGEGEK